MAQLLCSKVVRAPTAVTEGDFKRSKWWAATGQDMGSSSSCGRHRDVGADATAGRRSERDGGPPAALPAHAVGFCGHVMSEFASVAT